MACEAYMVCEACTDCEARMSREWQWWDGLELRCSFHGSQWR